MHGGVVQGCNLFLNLGCALAANSDEATVSRPKRDSKLRMERYVSMADIRAPISPESGFLSAV